MYRIYQVQAGETLESISNKLGVSPNVIVELNGLTSNEIMPGTYLVVPKTNEIFSKYIVKKGDNIYEIARRYDIDPKQLMKLNGLNEGDIIYPNQSILVPSGNVKLYITSEGDTLGIAADKLSTDVRTLNDQNSAIFLLPDQLLILKKE